MTDIAAAALPIQVEATRTTSPVSESLAQTMGSSINFCLINILPVGSVVESMLSEAQFQTESGTNWILADGRSVVGSRYEFLTGSSTVVDLRGRYPRAKDHGAGVDTHGDLALGTSYADQFKSHLHTVAITSSGGFTGNSYNSGASAPGGTINSGLTGAAETNPKTTILNFLIRID